MIELFGSHLGAKMNSLTEAKLYSYKEPYGAAVHAVISTTRQEDVRRFG